MRFIVVCILYVLLTVSTRAFPKELTLYPLASAATISATSVVITDTDSWIQVSPESRSSDYWLMFKVNQLDGIVIENSMLVAYDEAKRNIVWQMNLSDVLDGHRSPVLSPQVHYLKVIHGNTNRNDVKIRISVVTVTEINQISTESEFYEVDYRIAYETPNPKLFEVYKSVVLVEFGIDNNIFRCTGFLIADGFVITNQHCIGDQDFLNHEYKPRVYFQYSTRRIYKEVALVSEVIQTAQSELLDFSVLKLERYSDPHDAAPLKFAKDDVVAGMPLSIIHHYKGGVAVESFDNDCVVIEPEVEGYPGFGSNDFTHMCDTEKMSSGSPVLSRSRGDVVGLHHLGKVAGYWATNKAVKITRLLPELRKIALEQNFELIIR